jgi:hypothetical protein
MEVEHKEYTSSAQGNLNTVLGAIGTFGTLNGGGCGTGGLGGLFGGGCNNKMQELYAENAQLKADRDSSNKLEAYNANLMEKWLKPLADEVADSRVREARMEEQIKCIEKTHGLELALMRKDVELVKQDLTCCCTQNANAIAQVAAILGKVTNTIIPISAICPTPAVATTTAAAA